VALLPVLVGFELRDTGGKRIGLARLVGPRGAPFDYSTFCDAALSFAGIGQLDVHTGMM